MKKIKIANINDLENIIKIQNDSNEELLSKEVINSELNKDNFIYFIAYIDNIPVAYIAASYVLDTMDLLSILVVPKYRKSGLATELIETLLQFCNDKNINNVLLEVRPSNTYAIHLYEKFNFKQIDKRKNYYKNEDALIYKLEK